VPPVATSADEIYGLSRRLAASQARRTQEVSSDNPCGELERYLNDPLELPGTDILDFWMVSNTSIFPQLHFNFELLHTTFQKKGSTYPILTSIARDLLSVPASSIPCERAFSAAKHTDTDSWNRLTPEHLGAIQITKADLQRNYFKEREVRKAFKAEKVREWQGYEVNLMIGRAERAGFIVDS
jgi:hypothetical protein